tara:strand:- start:3537 stop:4040 length:504 start_codon:yes stop_codon:yes gene_type:complete
MAKQGLYANIHKKRARIKAGSGEKMRKPNSKGAPTAANFKRSAETAKAEMGGTMNNLNNTKMNLKKKKMKDGGKFGMLSVKAGYDNNPNATAADRIVGAKKSKKMYGGKMEEEKMMKKGGMKKKMGGKKKMYGGSAMKPMKKGMGGKMKYKTGGFTLEPKTPNLDDL